MAVNFIDDDYQEKVVDEDVWNGFEKLAKGTYHGYEDLTKDVYRGYDSQINKKVVIENFVKKLDAPVSENERIEGRNEYKYSKSYYNYCNFDIVVVDRLGRQIKMKSGYTSRGRFDNTKKETFVIVDQHQMSRRNAQYQLSIRDRELYNKNEMYRNFIDLTERRLTESESDTINVNLRTTVDGKYLQRLETNNELVHTDVYLPDTDIVICPYYHGRSIRQHPHYNKPVDLHGSGTQYIAGASVYSIKVVDNEDLIDTRFFKFANNVEKLVKVKDSNLPSNVYITTRIPTGNGNYETIKVNDELVYLENTEIYPLTWLTEENGFYKTREEVSNTKVKDSYEYEIKIKNLKQEIETSKHKLEHQKAENELVKQTQQQNTDKLNHEYTMEQIQNKQLINKIELELQQERKQLETKANEVARMKMEYDLKVAELKNRDNELKAQEQRFKEIEMNHELSMNRIKEEFEAYKRNHEYKSKERDSVYKEKEYEHKEKVQQYQVTEVSWKATAGIAASAAALGALAVKVFWKPSSLFSFLV